jgi:hypothetical protein
MALSNLVCPKSGTKMASKVRIIYTVFDIKPPFKSSIGCKIILLVISGYIGNKKRRIGIFFYSFK